MIASANTTLTTVAAGILEHNAVAITARALSEASYRAVLNFGCVGAYTGNGIGIGDCFFIRESRHFDVDLPGDVECPFDARSFSLEVLGDRSKAKVCRTGIADPCVMLVWRVVRSYVLSLSGSACSPCC